MTVLFGIIYTQIIKNPAQIEFRNEKGNWFLHLMKKSKMLGRLQAWIDPEVGVLLASLSLPLMALFPPTRELHSQTGLPCMVIKMTTGQVWVYVLLT